MESVGVHRESAVGDEMRPELIEVLNREAKSIMESNRERGFGYPETRRRIEDFISTLPLDDRERVRRALLPEATR